MSDKIVRKPYVGLVGSDFTKPPVPKDQAVCLVYAMAGHGKTTLGLSHAPGPVTFFDVDRRGSHAARVAQRKGKVIHYLPVLMPKKMLRQSDQELKRTAEAIVSKVRKNAEIAAREGQRGNVRTAVFDTMTEFCGLVNMAITGRVDKKKDDFGKSTHIVKSIIKDMIEMFRETPVNVIMLAKAKELWVGHEPSGKYTFQGLDVLEFESDWAGHLRLAKDKRTKLYRSQTHELEISKAGIDLSQLGAVYTEEDWGTDGPFVYASTMNYPGSTSDSWR